MNDLGGTGTNRGMNCQIGSGGCHNYNPPGTFGDSFNSHKGGVWATQIEAEGIKVWHFARGTEPADINSPSPDPTKWPKPVMNLGAANCNMKNVFRGMKIVGHLMPIHLAKVADILTDYQHHHVRHFRIA